ncbi:MAG: hypothetical protein PHG34_06715 [Candidatus Cloacimonetes bacterium]|nr:hypothetical protein [Candidatus Cloacimonadota bacterium]
MKRYILLVMLLLFMAALMAETGLFDLSYGQDMADAHTALLAKGFEETKRGAHFVVYDNDQIPGLMDLEIRDIFEDGTVSSWTARYYLPYAPGLVGKMLADLKAYHQMEPELIYPNTWTWEFGYPNELDMRLSVDQLWLVIDYTNLDEQGY